MLPGMVPAMGLGKSCVVSMTATATNLTGQTTYTFASQSFGAVASGRIIIATTHSRVNSSLTCNSCTIGGVSATKIAEARNTDSGSDIATIWGAAVPTGTSGTIAVTYSGAMLRAGLSVYRVLGTAGSVTAFDTVTDLVLTGSALSGGIDCAAGGVIIGCGNVIDTGTPKTLSWSNLTERWDSGEIAGNFIAGSAADAFLAPQTARTITLTSDGGTTSRGALAVASWSPA